MGDWTWGGIVGSYQTKCSLFVIKANILIGSTRGIRKEINKKMDILRNQPAYITNTLDYC